MRNEKKRRQMRDVCGGGRQNWGSRTNSQADRRYLKCSGRVRTSGAPPLFDLPLTRAAKLAWLRGERISTLRAAQRASRPGTAYIRRSPRWGLSRTKRSEHENDATAVHLGGCWRRQNRNLRPSMTPYGLYDHPVIIGTGITLRGVKRVRRLRRAIRLVVAPFSRGPRSTVSDAAAVSTVRHPLTARTRH